jgi:hypothetical protein
VRDKYLLGEMDLNTMARVNALRGR